LAGLHVGRGALSCCGFKAGSASPCEDEVKVKTDIWAFLGDANTSFSGKEPRFFRSENADFVKPSISATSWSRSTFSCDFSRKSVS